MTAHSLKTSRKKLGLTQYGLAKYSRISLWSIKAFEAGYRELTDNEVSRINDALIKKEASLANTKSKPK